MWIENTGSRPLTRFSTNTVFQITQFILALLFVHLVLNHSSAYTVFCLIHGSFSKVSKNSIGRGPPVYWIKLEIIILNSVCKWYALLLFCNFSHWKSQSDVYQLLLNRGKPLETISSHTLLMNLQYKNALRSG